MEAVSSSEPVRGFTGHDAFTATWTMTSISAMATVDRFRSEAKREDLNRPPFAVRRCMIRAGGKLVAAAAEEWKSVSCNILERPLERREYPEYR
jgi:hypothetical protein